MFFAVAVYAMERLFVLHLTQEMNQTLLASSPAQMSHAANSAVAAMCLMARGSQLGNRIGAGISVIGLFLGFF